MRRVLAIATFCLTVVLLPVSAQIHGTPPSVTSLGPAGFGQSRFSGGNVFVSGRAAFGHNPRFRVFFEDPFFFHRRFFHRPFFFHQPLFVPVPVYAGSSYPIVIQTTPQVSEIREQRELVGEVERLREEVARLREDQAEREQQRLREREGANQVLEENAVMTILVFRDGHQLVVRNYAIVGETVWVFSEKRARKILLSALDLDATAKLNEERGVEFRLPARQKAR